MAKLHRVTNPGGTFEAYVFWCPGCSQHHQIATKGSLVWEFNGDLEKPTFSPSLLVEPRKPERRCHLFLREGKIQYLGDCFHELKGRTIELPDFDAELEKEREPSS